MTGSAAPVKQYPCKSCQRQWKLMQQFKCIWKFPLSLKCVCTFFQCRVPPGRVGLVHSTESHLCVPPINPVVHQQSLYDILKLTHLLLQCDFIMWCSIAVLHIQKVHYLHHTNTFLWLRDLYVFLPFQISLFLPPSPAFSFSRDHSLLSQSDYIIKEKTVLLQKKDNEGFGFVLRGAKGESIFPNLLLVLQRLYRFFSFMCFYYSLYFSFTLNFCSWYFCSFQLRLP